ncbi:hypothetical protein TpMuguga_03g00477 [Theileria parva strain Muguga]|uniref:Uncharacterized protein n=1 Tax=Theileria parva TaxID=5875 RepID=Q4MZP0_THEPA|nr:uncharacterized protein TpMuguga_03g00477 [Theileria parva strain Muguga]EAN31221.1 hypothetical protein TpMuguga_03g00477 [Theileria parva strain Muguga]|eukprot:XP_763504.1 hypothetical protein [Theileria parva strain Muguga]
MVRKEYEHKAKLVNGLPVLYCKFGKNKPWVNITSTRPSITLFTFTDSDNITHSISECDITLNELVIKIVFKFDVTQISFANQIIWRFCECFWSGYPRFILFDLVKNKFKLVFDHGIERRLETKFTVVGRECGGVVDIAKYETRAGSDFLIFTIKDKLSLVRQGDEVIWERLPHEPHPYKMLIDVETEERILLCDDRFFVCRRENGVITRDSHTFTPLLKEMLSNFERHLNKN